MTQTTGLGVITMAAATEIGERNRKVLSRGVVTCAAVVWATVLIAYGDDQAAPPREVPPPAVISVQ